MILVKTTINTTERRAGSSYPLGATVQGAYVNFAVPVPGAEEVVLRIYRGAEETPAEIYTMGAEDRFGSVFSVSIRLPGETPEGGWQYDYETKGERFNDPYAKLIAGRGEFGRRPSVKESRKVRAVVRPGGFRWDGETRPNIAMSDMILYKLHVRGFTKETRSASAGTYAALGNKAEYLRELGVNAVLLMPILEFNETYREGDRTEDVPNFVSSKFYRGSMAPLVPEDFTEKPEEGRVNYWGYAKHYFFFAPKASYASSPAQADLELQRAIRKLHNAGIEVFLEFMIPQDTNRSLVTEALRFWVREYHIDGFRINAEGIDTTMVATDPYLAGVKFLCGDWDTDRIYRMTAEPKTPALARFDDSFQITARRFVKGDEGMAHAFAECVVRSTAGAARVNYITDHNGFTLADLYMYDVKHNDANGERGRDGSDYNYSWNCGAEGADKRRKIRDLRRKMRKNAMAAMLFSQGTPMLLAGDEFGNSQEGNNNAYNQDNPIGWVNWSQAKKEADFTAFVREAIALRKAHPVLHNPAPLRGTDYLSCGAPDVSVHGRDAWREDNSPYNRCVGILLSGDFAAVGNDRRDDSFYLIFNMYWEEQTFAVPVLPGREDFVVALSTDAAVGKGTRVGDTITVPARTIVILQSAAAARKERRVTRRKNNDKGEPIL
ncbi:MAG: hypothetical protein IKX54_00655 [Lachnospiraceae bacterium]|nr:hypothetical protein [Lachnospiraceae bacterium]